MTTRPTGITLEARVQRLFLAQGIFAERRLWPSVTTDRRMLATDIDVLVSEYASGFHLTRRHAECKGGKLALLDRILWLNGVRTLLGADATYLVGQDLDLDASEFARRLSVELITFKHLEAWETSLGIPPDTWPCRTDLQLYEAARDRWQELSGEKGADEAWRWLRDALAFIEIESWLAFRYRHLNKTLRLFVSLAVQAQKNGLNTEQLLCANYVFSALLVRFTHHLLGVCLDVSTILPTDVKKYLLERLTFGDQDPKFATGLIQGTVQWIDKALKEGGSGLPSSIDVSRLYAAPAYGDEFAELIQRLLNQSNEARYLPIAMEMQEFGHRDIEQKIPRLRAAAAAGDSLAALVKGFVIRAFSPPQRLIEPVGAALEPGAVVPSARQLTLKDPERSP